MNAEAKVNRKGRATIVDVGRVAGVSDATVSRAINKPDTVSGATRERILQAIIETGYIPNRAAKAMASGRTHTVGALIPTLDHAIFAKFLNALEAELSTQGYGLIVAVTEGNPNIEIQKAEKLISMGVEGLVVSGLAHNDKLLNYTSRANTPIVATSYFEPTSNIPTVGYDNERAAKRAAQHLMSLGHQNIAVAHGPISNNDRTRSRIRALSAIGGNVRFRFIETTLDHVGGSAAAERLAPHDTALLCLSDVLAVGALHRLTTLNFSIPDDLSVMGFDNIAASEFTTPPLTTVSLPIVDMGATTARVMCDYLENGIAIPSRELASSVIVRDSTAAPKQ